MTDKNTEQHILKVYKRPWFEWLSWGIWITLEVFFLQNAIASRLESETRAALIFWMIFITLFLGGIAAYISRRLNLI